MSMWQFSAAIHGWNEAQGGGENKLSVEEKDELWKWLDTKPATVVRQLH